MSLRLKIMRRQAPEKWVHLARQKADAPLLTARGKADQDFEPSPAIDQAILENAGGPAKILSGPTTRSDSTRSPRCR
jgi:hypothetical protein